MKSWLLDGNVLVALLIDSHVHHLRVRDWFSDEVQRFSTCCITQGTLLRIHMQTAEDPSAAAAWQTLEAVSGHPFHAFWDDGMSYTDVPHHHLQGPKQVTGAWLAQLARKRKGRLATLDKALAGLHPDVAVVIPES